MGKKVFINHFGINNINICNNKLLNLYGKERKNISKYNGELHKYLYKNKYVSFYYLINKYFSYQIDDIIKFR